MASGSARADRTTSMSGMRWTGEKKCMPTTRSGARARRAISAMGSAEVFEAITASGRRTCSSSSTTRCLVASSSNTASMTRSAPLNPARSGPPVMRPTMRAASRRSNTPFFAASAVSWRIVESPFATAAASRSRARTRRPPAAAACAMPEPMKPRPTTPTAAMGRARPRPWRTAFRWWSVRRARATRFFPVPPTASSPSARASASRPAAMPFARPVAIASIAARGAG